MLNNPKQYYFEQSKSSCFFLETRQQNINLTSISDIIHKLMVSAQQSYLSQIIEILEKPLEKLLNLVLFHYMPEIDWL